MLPERTHTSGFAVVELVLAIFITLAVIAFFYGFMHGSLKVFKDVKSISDTVETKTPSIELMTRFFDRWGVGVPQSPPSTTTSSCATYPVSNRKCVTITQGDPCDTVEFYANTQGFGFVRDVSSGTATVASCRLTTVGTNQNCYYLWDGNQLGLANDLDSTYATPFLIPLQISSLSNEDADCTAITQESKTNATMSATLSPDASYLSRGFTAKTVNPGDVVQRIPHRVRFSCSADDAGQRWLMVTLFDMCTNQWDQGQRVAPIDAFHVQGEPSSADCSAQSGGICRTVRVTVTFRSEAQKYASGQYDTYTVEKVMGR